MIKVLYKTYIDFTIVLCPLYCKPGFVRGGRNEKWEGERTQGVGEGRRGVGEGRRGEEEREKGEKGWEKGKRTPLSPPLPIVLKRKSFSRVVQEIRCSKVYKLVLQSRLVIVIFSCLS